MVIASRARIDHARFIWDFLFASVSQPTVRHVTCWVQANAVKSSNFHEVNLYRGTAFFVSNILHGKFEKSATFRFVSLQANVTISLDCLSTSDYGYFYGMSNSLHSAPQSPFQSDHPPGRFQFSLGSLLLVMLVFCFTSLGLYYSIKVPAIANEIYAVFGISEQASMQNNDRTAQFAFVMFCFTGPLLAAAITSLTTWFVKQYARTQVRAQTDPEDAPF